MTRMPSAAIGSGPAIDAFESMHPLQGAIERMGEQRPDAAKHPSNAVARER